MKVTSLSANTLFHFTTTLENLDSILINEFYPNYSLENWDPITGDNFEIAIPMVCFCDIPLPQIYNHTENYGYYALGMSKNWGKKHSISPVLYTFKEASPTKHIYNLMTHLSGTDYEGLRTLLSFSHFMKPYEGKLWRGRELKEWVRFYDEREWRYVPPINKGESIEEYLLPDEFHDEVYRAKEAEKLKGKKLSFEPKDIRYIIVRKENEIHDMIGKVRAIKGDFPYRDVQVLITKIISMEQIQEDF